MRADLSREEKTTSRGFTGHCTITYPNGDTYVGDLKDGLRDSENGKYTYAAFGQEEGERDSY